MFSIFEMYFALNYLSGFFLIKECRDGGEDIWCDSYIASF